MGVRPKSQSAEGSVLKCVSAGTSRRRSADTSTRSIRPASPAIPRCAASQRAGGSPLGIAVASVVLGRVLGEGTFGQVRLGHHKQTGGRVAAKILMKGRIMNMADVKRVSREIRILKIVRHSSIIQLYEVVDTPSAIFFITEHCDGGELFDFIVRHQRLLEPQACFFYSQLIDGLEYLHQKNVTHRDIKPENLLLQSSPHGWRLKIIDFGLSNTHEGDKKLSTACGSPCYAAPEMIAGKKDCGPAADIWSAGIVLFTLIAGFLPFEDPSTSKLYKKILSGVYAPPSWASQEARSLLSAILNTDPNTRADIPTIKSHSWFRKCCAPIPAPLIFPTCEAEIDAGVLARAVELGMDKEKICRSLLAGSQCNETTTYYLLLKSTLDEASLSPRHKAKTDSFAAATAAFAPAKHIKASRTARQKEESKCKATNKGGDVNNAAAAGAAIEAAVAALEEVTITVKRGAVKSEGSTSNPPVEQSVKTKAAESIKEDNQPATDDGPRSETIKASEDAAIAPPDNPNRVECRSPEAVAVRVPAPGARLSMKWSGACKNLCQPQHSQLRSHAARQSIPIAFKARVRKRVAQPPPSKKAARHQGLWKRWSAQENQSKRPQQAQFARQIKELLGAKNGVQVSVHRQKRQSGIAKVAVVPSRATARAQSSLRARRGNLNHCKDISVPPSSNRANLVPHRPGNPANFVQPGISVAALTGTPLRTLP